MRKVIPLILSIFLLFFALNMKSKAQVDTIIVTSEIPCTSDHSYPNDAWLGSPEVSGMANYIIVECGGCYYLVEWYYRQTAVVRVETQITKVSKLGYSNQQCVPGCDFSKVKRNAYKEIWEDLFKGTNLTNKYYLNPNSTPTQYTVQESQCNMIQSAGSNVVKVDDRAMLLGANLPQNIPTAQLFNGFYYFNLDIEIVSCASICCRMFYDIEKNGDEIISVEWTEIHGYGYLEQEECPNPPISCVNSCDDLRWNWNPVDGYSYGYYQKSTSDISNTFIDRLIISPNPVSDKLKFTLENNYLGRVEIKIHSLQGDILKSYVIEKESILFQNELDLKGLINGTYFLQLQFSNQISNYKFVISN